MQDFGGDTGRGTTSWYLARGNKRYGPLADRELLLLAKRGRLRTDDLLWGPGFSSWKPVHAVCGVEPSTTLAKERDTSPEDMMAAPACRSSNEQKQLEMVDAAEDDASLKPKPNLKVRIYDELRRFLMIFAYLWLVFLVFLVHEWIVLADNHIGFRFYGLAAINALVLSKIMMIAEELGYAERFDNRPLIIPIIYKSVLFSVLLVAAYILEEVGVGLFHGKGASESFPELGGGGVIGTFCVMALLCVALVPFFAFKEIAHKLGEAEFRSLMLGPISNKN